MPPRDSYASIPVLKVGSEEVADDKDKAKVFLEIFVTKMAEADEEEKEEDRTLPEEMR